MTIAFDQSRWDKIRETHRRWWAGELGRPLVHLTVKNRRPKQPEPRLPSYEFASFYNLNTSAEAIADRWLYDLECREFLGDAFPFVFPNFGPGVIAAFLGLELKNGEGTVWFNQPNDVALRRLPLKFDPENTWFRRLCDLYRAAGERFEGLVQLGMTDLGGNLDILASFRPGEKLLLDLYDSPDEVRAACDRAHAAWWECFEALDNVIQPAHPGYTAWTPFYSERPYYILQCDFAFMIGVEMFVEFALPELQATCRRLVHPFYHLDGIGQLKHLDALLEIPEMKGIQWVPGVGKPGITEWPEVYRKIRQSGKMIQFFTSQDPRGWRALDILVGQLGDAKGIMMYGEVPAVDEPEVQAMLKRYGID